MAAPAGLGVREHRRKFYQALVEDLLIFAEHAFRDAQPTADGASEGDHKRAAAEQWAKLGKPRLAERVKPAGPRCPPTLAYLWAFFIEIESGLPINGMAVPAVSWEAVQAWQAVTRTAIEPWEARILVRLGRMRAVVESERKADGGQGKN